MDAYIQTWLQFAFPLYIWMIIGVIVYLSRHSITIVKLVGSSAVSVLASYSVSALLCQTATNCNYCLLTCIPAELLWGWQVTSCLVVWWKCPFSPRKAHSLVPDGHGCHSVLYSSIRPALVCPLHTNLQPLSIQASKDETLAPVGCIPSTINLDFWTGFILVVRSILFVGYGLDILGDPDINHLLTVSVLALLHIVYWNCVQEQSFKHLSSKICYSSLVGLTTIGMHQMEIQVMNRVL